MRYIYGFIKAEGKPDFGPIGIGGDGETVYGFPYDGVAALISETSNASPSSVPQEELVESLALHQLVAEKVMTAGFTILPMKFGTVLESETRVAETLQANREMLLGLLDDIEGLFEIEVVAMWHDVQEVFAEIAAQKDIMELKKQVAKLPPDESMAERLSLGKLVKDRLDAKKRGLQERILPAWEQVARRTVHHELRQDAMVVNAAFLLHAARRDTLEALVSKTDREEGGSLDFRIVGPLPPYSFSTVHLQRAQLDELDAARRELALSERITPPALADAARSAMRRFHPDANMEDSSLAQSFERIKAAAELLKRFCPPQGLDLSHAWRSEFLLIEPMEIP